MRRKPLFDRILEMVPPWNEHQDGKSEGQRTRAKFVVSRVDRNGRLFCFVSHLGNVGEVKQFTVLSLFQRYLPKGRRNGTS